MNPTYFRCLVFIRFQFGDDSLKVGPRIPQSIKNGVPESKPAPRHPFTASPMPRSKILLSSQQNSRIYGNVRAADATVSDIFPVFAQTNGAGCWSALQTPACARRPQDGQGAAAVAVGQARRGGRTSPASSQALLYWLLSLKKRFGAAVMMFV